MGLGAVLGRVGMGREGLGEVWRGLGSLEGGSGREGGRGAVWGEENIDFSREGLTFQKISSNFTTCF